MIAGGPSGHDSRTEVLDMIGSSRRARGLPASTAGRPLSSSVPSSRLSAARYASAFRVRPRLRHRPSGLATVAVVLCAGSLVIAACSASGNSGVSHKGPVIKGKPIDGGVASYALGGGGIFNWMLPLDCTNCGDVANQNEESDFWRPLFWAGGPGTTGINYKLSIGRQPVYSNGNTEVTITLNKGWKWSDGAPVTTSDVRFFFEIEAAAAKSGKYANYLPGYMPDNIASVSYSGLYQFTIHLKQAFNPEWLTGNQLTWIFPLPQHAWDKTCSGCKVGNNSSTPAGALKVWNYLYSQSQQLSTYATNPLWKVVDGPWVIKSYDQTTYHAVIAANRHYTGPGKPHLAGYQIYSFTSETAEVNALRSGTIDQGYLPYSDIGTVPYFKSHGYNVVADPIFGNQVAEFNFTGPWKSLVSQLYIRQALQHLVNEPLYIKQTFHGYGLPDYGSVAAYPHSNLVSPLLRKDLYPYSVSAAEALLTAHGWKKGPNGTDICERPGSASSECGAGIPKGQELSIPLTYTTGFSDLQAQVQAFSTAAAQAGVKIPLVGQTYNSQASADLTCPPGPCNWGMTIYPTAFWVLAQQDDTTPLFEGEFSKGNTYAGGYNSAEAQSLIHAAETQPGLKPLYNAQNFLSKDVASLWWPIAAAVIVSKDHLGGWYPFNPYTNPDMMDWYLTK
ncbi:MAG: ABC transporter substrate-binding protein [Streptosporangiaceae bacterium]